MKATTFCAAMCVAIASASTPDTNAATFGPRASTTATAQHSEKPKATRRLVKHLAGPRGTIAVLGKVDRDTQMAEDNSGSCHWARRSGPRASLC